MEDKRKNSRPTADEQHLKMMSARKKYQTQELRDASDPCVDPSTVCLSLFRNGFIRRGNGEKRLRYTSENQWSVGAMKPNVKIWFKLQEVIREVQLSMFWLYFSQCCWIHEQI